MNKDENTCRGCIWADICKSNTKCEDYTPADTEDNDIQYYEKILQENADEYRSLVEKEDS